METLHCVFMFPLYSLGFLNFDIDTAMNIHNLEREPHAANFLNLVIHLKLFKFVLF